MAPAPQYAPNRPEGFPSLGPSIYKPYRVSPALQMIAPSAARGPLDMLSTPLGQHILDYDPPRGFSILPFAMYDGSFDPYDHMLHYNQAMILSVGDDRLLCKVFPASLKGPALAWFHKLPRGSISTFGNYGPLSSPNIYALSGKKGISAPSNPSSNGKTNPSGTSHAGLGRLFSK